jgi:lipoprotein-releasing system permease protein
MTYEQFIGKRYLSAKRRGSVLSIITIIAIVGVALGVTALIVVLSVMGGFKKDLMTKIIGAKAHIVVKHVDGADLVSADDVLKAVEAEPSILGASPYLEGEVMGSSPTNLSGIVLRGIDPDRILTVSSLGDDMRSGKMEFLRDPAPLLRAVRDRRARDLDGLLERLDRERSDLAQVKNVEKGDSRNVLSTPLGDGVADPGDFSDDDPVIEMPGFDEEDVGETPPVSNPLRTSPSEKYLPGLILGAELAKSLQVELGAEINVVTPKGELGPSGPIPRSRPFRIVGVFYSGMYEYDANFAYTLLDDARSFLGRSGISGVEMKTTDIREAERVASELQKALGPGVNVLDWKEMNRSLFLALKLEKIAMFIVLTFIILVASFSIVAMLIMIVIQKSREIAVLKSMGASDRGIMRTFIYQGLVIGLSGAVIGLGFGLGICYALATFGFPLNSEVYYINTLPVHVDPVEVMSVLVSAVGISFLATIYPSLQAARLNPVEGLKYD